VVYFMKLFQQSLGRTDERNKLKLPPGRDLNTAKQKRRFICTLDGGAVSQKVAAFITTAVRTKAKTSLHMHTRRWRCIAEGGRIHNYRCENKSRKVIGSANLFSG
jgi:hypothetical protein